LPAEPASRDEGRVPYARCHVFPLEMRPLSQKLTPSIINDAFLEFRHNDMQQ
jgi:hypothetical protein